jgi:hypothetical protein
VCVKLVAGSLGLVVEVFIVLDLEVGLILGSLMFLVGLVVSLMRILDVHIDQLKVLVLNHVAVVNVFD